MGVELSTWVETVRKHPLKFRFEGLDGWHEDVREACIADKQFMDRYVELEAKGQLENYLAPELKDDVLALELKEDAAGIYHLTDEAEDVLSRLDTAPGYIAWLIRHMTWRDEPETVGDLDDEDKRREWCYDRVDASVCWDMIREDEPGFYLQRHPPVEVLDPTSQQGVPIEDVWFLCPSCGRYPATKEEHTDHFYCGLCGAESCLSPDETMADFIVNLGIKEWPFRAAKDLHDLMGSVGIRWRAGKGRLRQDDPEVDWTAEWASWRAFVERHIEGGEIPPEAAAAAREWLMPVED